MSQFKLPVLGASAKPVTPADLILRSLHAEAIYDAALGDTVHLDIGTAIMSPDLPDVDMANEIRDVQTPAGTSPDAATAAALAVFAARGLRPLAWSFSGGRMDPDIAAALETHGYRHHVAEVWALNHPQIAGARSDLAVISARASYPSIREILTAVGADIAHEPPARIQQYAEAAVRTLDDPRVDALLALHGETPVGLAYLVTAGESGFLADLYVHPAHRRSKVATTLLERIVELATRSRHRSLTLLCRPNNPAARALYEKTGWSKVGEVASMRLDAHPDDIATPAQPLS